MTNTDSLRPTNIQQLSETINEGERNYALFKQACYLRGHSGLDESGIARVLEGINANRCKPPLDDQEVRAIAKSAARYPAGNPVIESQVQGMYFSSWGKLSEEPYQPLEYVIYGLPRGSVGLLTGVSNLGKSTLARNIAFSLANGTPYLGIVESGPPRRVMIADFETPESKFRSEMDAMSSVPTANPYYLSTNLFPYIAQKPDSRFLNLSREEHLWEIESDARRIKPDVIVIDTASAAFSIQNENDNAEVTNKLMKPLQKLATRLNCVVLLVHHIGKSGSEEGSHSNGLYRARGASSFVGLSMAVLQMDTKKASNGEQTVTLEYVKVKDEKPQPVALKFDPESHWFLSQNDVTPYNDRSEEDKHRLLQLVSGETSTAEIARLASTELKLSRSTTERYVRQLENAGDLVRTRHGFYAPAVSQTN